MLFSVLCLLCLCARLFICALWSPAGKGLISWLSFVVSNCEFVTFPLVSWVRCGTCLYRFMIFAPLLTLAVQYINIIFVCNEELKGGMQGYSLCLLGNQQKFQLQPFGCKLARATIS